ncbi:MAG: MFS transporter [Anaerocolumna sp.]
MLVTKENFKHTIIASYIGYITQAIVNNFAPLLFLTFQRTYGITYDKIALLVTVNFTVQLTVDILSAKIIDKIGYRVAIVSAHIFAGIGLASLAFLPEIVPNSYLGLLIAIVLYAIGGGIIEVLVSPIIEACPTENKEASMSLLHSFYCWGQVSLVLLSTLFFTIFGISNWRILALIWAIIPLCNSIYYARVPINELTHEGDEIPLKTLFTSKLFWCLLIVMVGAGASELAMSQWASAFAEAGLKVSKTVGDLAGPCTFAIFMGLSRVFYAKFSDKINLTYFMTGSGVLCIISYLMSSLSKNPVLALVGCGICGLSVGILWPGTYSIAAKRMKRGGTALFAMLALAGDLGCAIGPATVGVVSRMYGEDLKKGLLVACIFPIIFIIALLCSNRLKGSSTQV